MSFKRKRRRAKRIRRIVGPAAVGAFYEMLHQDKRRAIEVIVERKAEEQLPEDAEGSE